MRTPIQEVELSALRRLVKEMAEHLRVSFKDDMDSEMTEFCSYADRIDIKLDAEGVAVDDVNMDMPPIEDEDDDGFDPDAIVLED
jgi:hypothetical protein